MNTIISRALAEVFIPPKSEFAQPSVSITGTDALVAKIDTVVGWMFYGLIAFAVVEIILAGFAFLNAKGDTKAMPAAQNRIIYAAVAIGVALLARSVPYIVKNFIG